MTLPQFHFERLLTRKYLLTGISHPSGQINAITTASTFTAKNGPLFTIHGNDTNSADVVLLTCCTLAGMYLVCDCRQRTNCQRYRLGYR